jgi:hypothetical protein
VQHLRSYVTSVLIAILIAAWPGFARTGIKSITSFGRDYRSQEAASKAMLKEFMRCNRWKRGDVLMTEAWYEPNQLLEVTR